jgi:hypothetical protein
VTAAATITEVAPSWCGTGSSTLTWQDGPACLHEGARDSVIMEAVSRLSTGTTVITQGMNGRGGSSSWMKMDGDRPRYVVVLPGPDAVGHMVLHRGVSTLPAQLRDLTRATGVCIPAHRATDLITADLVRKPARHGGHAHCRAATVR